LFDKDDLVIELVGQKKATKRLVKIVKYYAEQGYKVALADYDVSDSWDVLLPYLAIVKIDIEKINPKRIKHVKEKIKAFNIKLSAEKVETKYQLQSLTEVGFNYFQGFFYHKPELIEGQTLEPIKAQMLQLISESFKTPLNYNAVSNIISRDVNLTIGLLKMVNNVSTGTQIEITSLKQAATYLGEDKLKQYVSVLALSKLSAEHADELSKHALITAKLMDAIAQQSSAFKDIREYAFITGLLCDIEAILQSPIEDIMQSMPLAPTIINALIYKQGVLGELLSFVSSYILGRNSYVEVFLTNFSLDADLVQQEFVKASLWCKELDVV
jgi:EAL and modified HD-GYP domain-containing signal transduction protein